MCEYIEAWYTVCKHTTWKRTGNNPCKGTCSGKRFLKTIREGRCSKCEREYLLELAEEAKQLKEQPKDGLSDAPTPEDASRESQE